MKINTLIITILALVALGCIAIGLAGCGHGHPAYAAAPPAGPNAHPAAMLQPGRKHLLGALTFYRQTKSNSGQAVASR